MVILKNPLLMAFERVCEVKTVHAAASDLHLTQAAVTKRIQALEKELGMSLFTRSRRGMSLTEEGQALLHYCKVTREAEGDLLSKIKGKERQEVSLTIAGPTSAISTRIAENCLPLYKKHPFLRLHLKSEDHANLIEMVRRGEADLAIVSPELVPNEMQSKVLKPDRYFLVASSRWHGRELKEIVKRERIIDFYDSDKTTLMYLKKFGFDKLVNRNRLFINENEALVRFFSAGVGYGTLTEACANPLVTAGKLILLNRGQVWIHRWPWFGTPAPEARPILTTSFVLLSKLTQQINSPESQLLQDLNCHFFAQILRIAFQTRPLYRDFAAVATLGGIFPCQICLK